MLNYKNKPIIVLILLAVALVLGYAIYVKMPKTSQSNITPQETQSSPATRAPEAATTSATRRPPWIASLSEADKALFNTPSSDASDEVKRKFSENLRSNAKSVPEITISKDCRPSPIAYSVDKSLSFKVKNTDTVQHKVFIYQSSQHVIEPSSTVTITLEKKGSISYGCDLYIPVGFLVTSL